MAGSMRAGSARAPAWVGAGSARLASMGSWKSWPASRVHGVQHIDTVQCCAGTWTWQFETPSKNKHQKVDAMKHAA